MAQSFKLSDDDLVEAARREAPLLSRSVAGQITHWARIGRAIERSGNFDYRKIEAVLSGSMSTDALGPEEHDVWLEAFGEKMATPSPEAEAFFAERRRLGRGVGLSDAGEIVRETGAR